MQLYNNRVIENTKDKNFIFNTISKFIMLDSLNFELYNIERQVFRLRNSHSFFEDLTNEYRDCIQYLLYYSITISDLDFLKFLIQKGYRFHRMITIDLMNLDDTSFIEYLLQEDIWKTVRFLD